MDKGVGLHKCAWAWAATDEGVGEGCERQGNEEGIDEGAGMAQACMGMQPWMICGLD